MWHRKQSPKAGTTGHAAGVASFVAAGLEAGFEDSIGQVAMPFVGADIGVAGENPREKLSALVVAPLPAVRVRLLTTIFISPVVSVIVQPLS
jgi:hypothetical protein